MTLEQTTAATIDVFTGSLDRLEVPWTRVHAKDLSQAVTEVMVEPVVAAPLPFEGLALPEEVADPTPAVLETAYTGITAARMGIASYGTIVIERGADWSEPVSLLCTRHVAVVRASDIAADMPAAFKQMGDAFRNAPTSFVLATGPSATADMGALVRGAHGPKEVHVIILKDQ